MNNELKDRLRYARAYVIRALDTALAEEDLDLIYVALEDAFEELKEVLKEVEDI